MFYILSRFFAVFASPWLYIIAILVVVVFIKGKKWRRGLLIADVAFLLFFTNPIIYNRALVMWTSGAMYELKPGRTYEYALLPGGFTSYDNIRKRVEYGFAADRLIDAVRFYKVGVVRKIIITGDGASCTSGGDKSAFLDHMEKVWGVRRQDVIIEPNAKNTFQNFSFTLRQMGRKMRGDSTLVINSAVYMKRTVQCCEQLNFHPDFYTTDINTNPHIGWEQWVPDFHAPDDWMFLIHEWIGCVAYKIL